jgi:hypothetical protein
MCLGLDLSLGVCLDLGLGLSLGLGLCLGLCADIQTIHTGLHEQNIASITQQDPMGRERVRREGESEEGGIE